MRLNNGIGRRPEDSECGMRNAKFGIKNERRAVLADKNKITTLQYQAAACTDELLNISTDIGKYVIPAYTGSDPDVFKLQAKVQLERIKRLMGVLLTIQKALQQAVTVLNKEAEDGRYSDPAGASVWLERKNSAQTTMLLITQNLDICIRKTGLLRNMLTGIEEEEAKTEAAKKLADTEEIMRLKETLGNSECGMRNSESD